MQILIAQDKHKDIWNEFVTSRQDSLPYHLFEWKWIIENTYGHKPIYLIAINNGKTYGVLPLFYIRWPFPVFPKKIVSLPFLDAAGILAQDEEIAGLLLNKAFSIASSLKSLLEIRQTEPISISKSSLNLVNKRVCLVLELPDSSQQLMRSFKSKLRSQIKRSIREGCKTIVGGSELINEFYKIFSINMRDLGSPVHSRKFFINVFRYLSHIGRIFLVYYKNIPVACSLILTYKETIFNPWASFLRKYKRFAPNMLLYWKMIEYGCNEGFKYFDFGRSTIGSGTYKFKKQWGGEEYKLYWYSSHITRNEREKFQFAENIWKILPISFTKVVGPFIRKFVSL